MKCKLALFLMGVTLIGCDARRDAPMNTVIVIDVSGSVDPKSLSTAIDNICYFAKQLPRGDRLTIIPVTSDALAESSGSALHFRIPAVRAAYDDDLVRFGKSLDNQLQSLKQRAIRFPGAKSDILGAISTAESDVSGSDVPLKSTLIILSDFIQDSKEINFAKDTRLRNARSAYAFASSIRSKDEKIFVAIRMGLLRSKDLQCISQSRREGILTFWTTYLARKTARPELSLDGLMSLRR